MRILVHFTHTSLAYDARCPQRVAVADSVVVQTCTTPPEMSEVALREPNQDTAGVRSRVNQGDEVEITERGSVIARPSGPLGTGHEAGHLVRELREDERYSSMLYLDTAALVKPARPESESEALGDYLDAAPETPLTSALIEVVLPRALLLSEPALTDRVPRLLARRGHDEIDETIRTAAAGYTDHELRSLDAIHLATVGSVAVVHPDGLRL